MLQLFIAILAGILTIGAPCILPLLPILLGASVGQTSKSRPIFIALGFVLMFSVVSLGFAYLVQNTGLMADTLRTVAIIALAIFGLLLIWPKFYEKLIGRLSPLFTRAESIGNKAGRGNGGGFVLGLMLGIIWTPCAGPVLGSILTLIVTQTDFARSAILLTGYAIGAGIPMIVIAYGGQYLTTRVRTLARYSTPIQQVFGVIILGLAVAMYYQYDLVLQAKLLELYDFSGFEDKLIPDL
jgi:cytochrome c-type biogenesis protein